MDFNARVDVTFARVDINFRKFFKIYFILISVHTKVPLILHTKIQPSHFGEMDLNASVDIFFFF